MTTAVTVWEDFDVPAHGRRGQDTLTEHAVQFLNRVSRALRNLADSADHAAQMVRKADAARRS